MDSETRTRPTYYRLMLMDYDGDEHEYFFAAENPWEILHFVHMNMAKSDFYGHTLHSCIEVHLAELVGEPTGGAIWV